MDVCHFSYITKMKKETLVWSRPFLLAKFHQKEKFRIQKSSNFGGL
jgi:hypothetical protein